MTLARRLSARIARAAAPLAVVLSAACTGGEATLVDGSSVVLDVPATPPSIRGVVTQVTAGDSVAPAASANDPSRPVACPPSCTTTGRSLRSVRVEEIPGPIGSGGDKSVVTILAGARILRRTANGAAAVGFGDLRAGQRVSVWFDGPVLESYPSQARGGAVVIEP